MSRFRSFGYMLEITQDFGLLGVAFSPFPFLQRGVPRRNVDIDRIPDGPADADVVDKDVEPAPGVDRRLDGSRARNRVGRIGGDDHRRAALRIEQRHFGSLSCEQYGSGPAVAHAFTTRACTRDDRDFVLETHLGHSLTLLGAGAVSSRLRPHQALPRLATAHLRWPV
jgi:hypothetical protein